MVQSTLLDRKLKTATSAKWKQQSESCVALLLTINVKARFAGNSWESVPSLQGFGPPHLDGTSSTSPCKTLFSTFCYHYTILFYVSTLKVAPSCCPTPLMDQNIPKEVMWSNLGWFFAKAFPPHLPCGHCLLLLASTSANIWDLIFANLNQYLYRLTINLPVLPYHVNRISKPF